MARLAQIACTATVFMAAGSLPVHADPINISIVSGSVVINRSPGNGSLTVAGTNGFTLTATGGVAPEAGLQGPFVQCLVPACTPGTQIDFDTTFTGQSGLLNGIVMTVGGNSFTDFESATATGNLVLNFSGSVIAPPLGPTQVSVSAPFSLTGVASVLTPSGQFAFDAILHGGGIATLTLVPYPTPTEHSWFANELRFDFSQPTPEPTTLLLLGSGAVAVLRKRLLRN